MLNIVENFRMKHKYILSQIRHIFNLNKEFISIHFLVLVILQVTTSLHDVVPTSEKLTFPHKLNPISPLPLPQGIEAPAVILQGFFYT